MYILFLLIIINAVFLSSLAFVICCLLFGFTIGKDVSGNTSVVYVELVNVQVKSSVIPP